MNNEITQKCIIISETNYKANDKIISIINEDSKLISLFVRSGLKDTNQNFFGTQILSHSNITYVMRDNNSMGQVRQSSEISSFDMNENFVNYLNLMILIELIKFDSDQRDEIYDELCFMLENINSNRFHTLCLNLIMKQIELHGIIIECDKCVVCNTKEKIKSFSARYLGYLCQKCSEKENQPVYFNLDCLSKIRVLKNANLKNLIYFDFEIKDYDILIRIINNYLKEQAGILLKSFEFRSNFK